MAARFHVKVEGTMIRVKTFNEFTDQTKNCSAVLLIKEQGCRYCEEAQHAIDEGQLERRIEPLPLFEIFIEDEPGLPTALGLVGVPAFLVVKKDGTKKIKVGFQNLSDLETFFNEVLGE